METGGLYEIRAAQGDALGFLGAAATRDHMDIIESVSADGVTSPRIVRLSVSGLPKALEQLKAACRERGMISDVPGIRFLDVSDAPAVTFLAGPGDVAGWPAAAVSRVGSMGSFPRRPG